MKRFFAPLFEALIQHAYTVKAGFHVPGHHYGQAVQPWLQNTDTNYSPALWFSAIMKLDVTELSTTDDLHHPEASIYEAQQLAATCFGADETFFLVGGSTSGNIALLLTVCEPNDIIIVQRNVHKSVINGLKLAGAAAVFLAPDIEDVTGLATVPSLQQVEDAMRLYPEAKAVFLSNPNYYGMGVSITPYADVIHKHGKLLLVDEAHGAHYGHHPKLPQSALAGGADAVVQSAHKTLPTLTMGAMLHVQGERFQRDLLRQSLAMIQSSSPSFPILASLDISRAMIDHLGAELFEQSLAAAASFRLWLEKYSTAIQALKPPTPSQDPLRVVIYDSSGVLSGYELMRQLERDGVFAEMADPRYALLIFGVQTSNEDVMKLERAIDAINNHVTAVVEASSGKQHGGQQAFFPIHAAPAISEPVSFARDRFKNKATARVELRSAVHKIAAEMVTPYPPGIAILYPGERITTSIVEQIIQLSKAGAKFQGAVDPSLSTIAVYES